MQDLERSSGGGPGVRRFGRGRLVAGKYGIERLLSGNSTSIVVEAHDGERLVALKCLRGAARHDAAAIESFLSADLQLAPPLPGFARVLASGRDEDIGAFVVYEHLQGADLANRLSAGSLPSLRWRVEYVHQACEALAALHERGFVHGRIRPSHLFVVAAAEPEPAFGSKPSAVLLSVRSTPWRPTLDALFDGSDRLPVALWFTSPEQLGGLPPTPESDIWSLGAVLYWLVTGHAPFEAARVVELVRRVRRDRPLPLAERLVQHGFALPASEALLPQLQTIVDRCLKQSPIERFAKASRLAVELRALLDSFDDESPWRVYPTLHVPSPAPVGRGSMPPVRSPSEVPGAALPRSEPTHSPPTAAPPTHSPPTAAPPAVATESLPVLGFGAALSEVAPIAPDTFAPDAVEFTVFRPKRVKPAVWYKLLAFVHPSERRADAPPDEPDPIEEVQRQAQRELGQALAHYQETASGDTHRLPREGELVFVPRVPGVEFHPLRQTIHWHQSVQRADFQLRARAGLQGGVQGQLSVFLGSLLIADVRLSFRVSADAPSLVEPERVSAAAYRKVFASYSHKDDHIVRQLERLARASGDRYLKDSNDLRSGQVWSRRLGELIEEADIFQLFWSSQSMLSPFVAEEWRHALALGKPEGFIRPVYWERPRPEADGMPPEELDRLHFVYIGEEPQIGPVALSFGTYEDFVAGIKKLEVDLQRRQGRLLPDAFPPFVWVLLVLCIAVALLALWLLR